MRACARARTHTHTHTHVCVWEREGVFCASAVVAFSSDGPVDFPGRKYMASVLCPGENAHRISPSSCSSVFFFFPGTLKSQGDGWLCVGV